MPVPLTNDRWGYESSCFVCERSNAAGLRIPFQLSDDGKTVSAHFNLGAEHSGAPTLVHGGLSLAILDEAQAWAVIAVTKKWGLTRSVEATFDGAVFIGHDHQVEAHIVEEAEQTVRTVATILDPAGTAVVRGSSVFTIVGVVDESQAKLGLTGAQSQLLREHRGSPPTDAV